MADEVKLLRKLSREVRNCAGLERTPDQLKSALRGMRCRSLYRAITGLLDNREAMEGFCREIRLKDHSKIPSSEELGL